MEFSICYLQVPFAHRVLQALVKMSFSSSRLRAKHFFDLHHPSAVSISGFVHEGKFSDDMRLDQLKI